MATNDTNRRHSTTERHDGVRRLRLALAQINTHVGALDANIAVLPRPPMTAYKAGAQVACFPELAIPGYPPEDLLLKPGFVEDNLAALATLTEESAKWEGMTLIVGFADRDNDLYNAAAILRDGQRRGVYHKQFLPNYGVFDEDRYFRPGDAAPNYVIDGVTVGISICEDIWYPGGPPTLQAYSGAEALLNISASPFFLGKQADRERMLATRAADTGAIVAYLNLVGGQDELIFDGSSVVFDGSGNLLARAKAFEEDLLIVDLEVDEVFRTRLHDPRRRKFHPALSVGHDQTIVISEQPIARKSQRERADCAARIEPPVTGAAEAYAALTLGVRDYVRKNGFTSAVIALSGGIDSALTAVIAVDALGAEAVTGVSMPSRYSSEGSKDDAKTLAEHLGIRYLTLPIEDTFAAMLKTLREPFTDDASPPWRSPRRTCRRASVAIC